MLNRKLARLVVLIIIILVVGGLALGPVLSYFAPTTTNTTRTSMPSNMKGMNHK